MEKYEGAQFKKEVSVLSNLFNPIENGEGITDAFFKKYIKIRDDQNRLLMTDPLLLEKIRKRFYQSHSKVPKEHLDRIWEFMFPLMQKNEALAKFVVENGGAESAFFFPWVMSVATSPSEALELSYNAGRNLQGEWITDIPKNDNIAFFVRNLPTLSYNRERQLKVAELAAEDQGRWRTGKKSVVVDLGAGRMAWARYHGFQPKPDSQQIYACDRDATIVPKELFPNSEFGKSGLKYERKDIMTELMNPRCTDSSLVILQGVASYYPMAVFANTIVKPVYTILRAGGKFFFDLQLNHISYEWSVKVFDWPEMKLPASASEAIDSVEFLRQNLWRDDQRFKAEYALDTYNASPLSVMVTMTKL